MKLYNDGKGRLGDGLFLEKFLTLFVGHTFQDVHRSFFFAILGQQACVGVEYLLMAVTLPGV